MKGQENGRACLSIVEQLFGFNTVSRYTSKGENQTGPTNQSALWCLGSLAVSCLIGT
jgi:hypothetical protein